jgi:hypothetical protein
MHNNSLKKFLARDDSQRDSGDMSNLNSIDRISSEHQHHLLLSADLTKTVKKYHTPGETHQ